MIFQSKAELIKDHEAGRLPVVATMTETNISGVAICKLSDEKVFGFQAYGDKKKYFFVKVYEGEDPYFKLQDRVYKLANFMRVRH